jgi:hypothetical protein
MTTMTFGANIFCLCWMTPERAICVQHERAWHHMPYAHQHHHAEPFAERGLYNERDALVNLLDEYAGRGYPALHHSEGYAAAYRPAYRVISREQADSLAAPAHR